MLLKWIVCSVPEKLQSTFSTAQEQWSELKHLPGFLGQIGGWDSSDHLQAGILSCWQDEAAYQHFMQHTHDSIVQQSQQKGTYTSLSITLFKEILPVPGSTPDFLSALVRGSILRVTDSQILPERASEFVHNQETIWNRGMAQAPGMQGGLLAQGIADPSRYLVASLWSDLQAHEMYRQSIFPSLREKANLQHTIQHIQGWVLQLEKSWQVTVMQ
jgi:heme-degrading monooxygenase HmoA